jgi:hypothetical protein
LSKLGERRGDPQPGADVDAEFVVAVAQILDDGGTGDQRRSGPGWTAFLRAQASPLRTPTRSIRSICATSADAGSPCAAGTPRLMPRCGRCCNAPRTGVKRRSPLFLLI